MSKKINCDHVERFHDDGIYIPTRTIYMGSELYEDFNEGGVDGLMAEKFVKNMHILEAESNEPINVIMNNTGGDEYHGFAIYDAIQCSPCWIAITVKGHAMSMGSIILQAADERIMAPTSRQMIHYGTWGYSDQHAKTAQKWSKEGLKIDEWMEQMYLRKIREKNPDFSLKKLKQLLDHDTFLTAEESVAIGLASAILSKPVKGK